MSDEVRPHKLGRSRDGSRGGRAMVTNWSAPGMKALMGAPRPYSAAPITGPSKGLMKTSANNRAQGQVKQEKVTRRVEVRAARRAAGLPPLGPPPAKRRFCYQCGEWFESVNAWGRHTHLCIFKEGAD